MSSAVGVGVIGTGFGRFVHIPALLQLEHARVIGVTSARYERAVQAATEFALPRSFPSWRELIACPDIQAVTVATPPAWHAEITVAACAAGKAVLCEKPLATNAAEAARMLQAARAGGVVHMVGFEFRELPAFQAAKRILESGRLGRLRHVAVTWVVSGWSDPDRQWSWRSERAHGGGALGALGVHALDYLEWLMGPITRLTAHLRTSIGQRTDDAGQLRDVDVEDCCHLLLELADGTPVSVVLSMVASHGRGHWLEIQGERKALLLGSNSASDYGRGFGAWTQAPGTARRRKVDGPRAGQGEEVPSDGRLAPFASLAQRFVDAVRENRLDARPSFEDGLRAQLLLDLAMTAHREGRWVDVPVSNKQLGGGYDA